MPLILFLFSLYYIDQPMARIPGHGIFNVQLRFGPAGEILSSFHLGIWDRLGLGISYGASNLLGAGNPEFYEQPGVQIRIVAVEEGFLTPVVVLGFDNQGYGHFDETTRRYRIMSKGLYCEAGRSFVSSNICFTPNIGFNYCFEADHRWDMFMGFYVQLGSSALFLCDYTPNFGDPLDQDHGYLNLGLRFVYYEQLFFEFNLRDLLDNSNVDQQFNRSIKIGYEQGF